MHGGAENHLSLFSTSPNRKAAHLLSLSPFLSVTLYLPPSWPENSVVYSTGGLGATIETNPQLHSSAVLPAVKLLDM